MPLNNKKSAVVKLVEILEKIYPEIEDSIDTLDISFCYLIELAVEIAPQVDLMAKPESRGMYIKYISKCIKDYNDKKLEDYRISTCYDRLTYIVKEIEDGITAENPSHELLDGVHEEIFYFRV